MRIFSIISSAAFAGSAVIACAQPPRPATPPTPAPAPRVRVVEPDDSCSEPEPGRIECRRMSIGPGGFGIRMDSAMMKRAALGLNLTGTGTMRDTLGVFVSSVTPNGPAEKAGIIEGDRIMSINGVDLRVSRADVEDSYASGLASRRLTREVQKLTPGSVANLRVWSGGRIHDVAVTTARAYDLMRERSGFRVFGGPGVYIFNDGMDVPFPPMTPMAPMEPMTPMTPMAPMAPMAPMEMNIYPRMERMREMFPNMRRMEMTFPRIRTNRDGVWMLPRGEELVPGRVYHLRNGEYAPLLKRKATAERRAKAKADSAKKRRD